MSSLIWIQTVRHSDDIPERNYDYDDIPEKVDFEKNLQTTKIHEQEGPRALGSSPVNDYL